jgi:hypothetical protein
MWNRAVACGSPAAIELVADLFRSAQDPQKAVNPSEEGGFQCVEGGATTTWGPRDPCGWLGMHAPGG